LRRASSFLRLLLPTLIISTTLISILTSAALAGRDPSHFLDPVKDEFVMDTTSRVYVPAVSNAGRKATRTPTPTSTPGGSPATPTPTPTPSSSAGSSTTYTIFGNQAPSNFDLADTSSVELGVKFRPTVSGYVLGVRFYKHSQTTGTHIGSLWTSAGTRLASATFTAETSSGWQQVYFASPVPVVANTIYMVRHVAP